MGPVRVLSPELVLVDWGPMTLTISAWRRSRPLPYAAAQAARVALAVLAAMAEYRGFLQRPAGGLPRVPGLPRPVALALAAARRAGGGLTPLAAVAGAGAETVAQAAARLGADQVVVNNGGDIALVLSGPLRVGIAEPGEAGRRPPPLARLNLAPGHGVGGVASSGWRGRSLSPGVADLVTCWSPDAALADACATLVAGAARCASPAVTTMPANRVDPASDLGRMPVTSAVGRLSPKERARALAGAMTAAEDLRSRGLLAGCLIRVQGETAVLDRGGLLSLPHAA